jgi:hypothetical protein
LGAIFSTAIEVRRNAPSTYRMAVKQGEYEVNWGNPNGKVDEFTSIGVADRVIGNCPVPCPVGKLNPK